MKKQGQVNNMASLATVWRMEQGRTQYRLLERGSKVEESLRKTDFSALTLNKVNEAKVVETLNTFAQNIVREAVKKSKNYKCQLLDDDGSGTVRILVTWKSTATERPTLTAKLPIDLSPEMKPRIVTVVVDRYGNVRLACECREFLNRQIVCVHHLCINGCNISPNDVHVRYWKK
jgi:hypothetical protein